MGATSSTLAGLVRLGIIAGFVGLGLLGIALIGFSITFPAAFGERVVVFLLGAFAFVIAVEAVPLMTGRTT